MPDVRRRILTAADEEWASAIREMLERAADELSDHELAKKLFDRLVKDWHKPGDAHHTRKERKDWTKELSLEGHNEPEQAISRAAHEIRAVLKECSADKILSVTLQDRTYVLSVELKPRAPRAIKSKSPEKLVALLAANPSEWHISHLIAGAERVLRAKGYQLLLVGTDNNSLTESDCLDQMSAFLEGIIAIPVWDADTHGAYARILESGFPLVFVDRLIRNFDQRLPAVTSDNVDGGFQATTHLIERHNCKRIHVVTEHQVSSLNQRQEGFRKAIDTFKKSRPCASLVWAAPERESAGAFRWAFRQTKQLIEDGMIVEGDGIFGLTDNVAAGCRAAIETLQFFVPVIGFDGQHWGAYLSPPLETVSQDMNAMGGEAALILLRQMDGAKETKTTFIPVELLTAETRLADR